MNWYRYKDALGRPIVRRMRPGQAEELGAVLEPGFDARNRASDVVAQLLEERVEGEELPLVVSFEPEGRHERTFESALSEIPRWQR